MDSRMHNYLKSNPDASLSEYMAYVEALEKAAKEKEDERYNQLKNLFKELIGKIIKLRHNDCSTTVFKVDCNLLNGYPRLDAYDIYSDGKRLAMEKSSRPINWRWLYDDRGKKCSGWNEISEDEYAEIENQFTQLQNNIKKII